MLARQTHPSNGPFLKYRLVLMEAEGREKKEAFEKERRNVDKPESEIDVCVYSLYSVHKE